MVVQDAAHDVQRAASVPWFLRVILCQSRGGMPCCPNVRDAFTE